MVQKKAFRFAVILAVVVVLLAFLKVYYVRTEPRGELFWNADGAYLFIGLVDRGYRISYLSYPFDWVLAGLPGATFSPNDDHFSALVLRVTPNSVERYSIDNFRLGTVHSFQGTLYAGNLLPRGGFMKWSGTQFEPTTPEEEQRYHEYAIKLPTGPPAAPSYDNVEGWSKRTLAGDVASESPTVSIEKDSKVTIQLDGKPLTFVMNSGFISHQAYVDLSRPGQAPERIWSLDEQSHRVSGAEYRQIFKTQKPGN